MGGSVMPGRIRQREKNLRYVQIEEEKYIVRVARRERINEPEGALTKEGSSGNSKIIVWAWILTTD
jgi:hypothetical protein